MNRIMRKAYYRMPKDMREVWLNAEIEQQGAWLWAFMTEEEQHEIADKLEMKYSWARDDLENMIVESARYDRSIGSMKLRL